MYLPNKKIMSQLNLVWGVHAFIMIKELVQTILVLI